MKETTHSSTDPEPSTRGSKTICLDFRSEAEYAEIVQDPRRFRAHVDAAFAQHPELFPPGFGDGYHLFASYVSTKQKVTLRRITVLATGAVFQVRPSFLMPFMIGTVQEVEKALFLRRWGVPFDALAYVFGRDPMYWYRATLALGRPSIVGTTVKAPEALPTDLVADEKHTWIDGTKAYVPVTAAAGVILGVSVVCSASAEDLEQGYGDFAKEAKDLKTDYSPETVCLDGWDATSKAWRSVFPKVTVVLCFLHAVLKIARQCTKNRALRATLLDKFWTVYEAETRGAFSQRLRRVREWALDAIGAEALRETVLKVCARGAQYAVAYAHAAAHRTSNSVDRPMDMLDRTLYAMRYFHGTRESARLAMRATALLYNFHPYGARTQRADPKRRSPFHDLNGFEYHANWLENLLIASSRAGRRSDTT